jgi:hypothetical protein
MSPAYASLTYGRAAYVISKGAIPVASSEESNNLQLTTD